MIVSSCDSAQVAEDVFNKNLFNGGQGGKGGALGDMDDLGANLDVTREVEDDICCHS